MFQTQDLLAAAQHLHGAIRAAVDPEAFSDFHGEHPFIELRDPQPSSGPGGPGPESLHGRLPQWPRYRPTSTSRPAVRQPGRNHDAARTETAERLTVRSAVTRAT